MKHARLAISPVGFEHKAFDMKRYIAKHKLIEIIYVNKDRVPLRDAQLTEDEQKLNIGTLVLSTDSDLFKFLRGMTPGPATTVGAQR